MINWKEIPFVRFLIPFASGITLSTILNNNHPIWYGIFLLSALFRFVFVFKKIPYRYRLIHGIIANTMLFLMGYLWCIHFNELKKTNHFQQYIAKENITIGVISNTPKTNKYHKVLLSTLFIGIHSDSLKTANGNILVYLKNDSITPLQYGDVVAFKGRIQQVPPPKNPYAFDYQRYLHFQNIHYQSFVNHSKYWKKTAHHRGHFISQKAIEVKSYLSNILKKHLTTPNELAVANALILGDKDDLDETIKTAYTHTGALHVLAVSGLHVGLVAWFVSLLLNLVSIRNIFWKITETCILITVVWSFAMISGGSPSVLRAATMFTFLIIGLSINRSTNIYNSLGISAVILLFWNPYLLVNVSFQLSYLAILGIIYFQPKIYSAWIIKNRLGRFFWKMSSVTFGAQIGTLPIALYYFHSFPFFAWLSGIIVIPAATIILGSGILLFTLESLVPALAFIPSTVLYYSIWLMNYFIFLIEKIPFSVQVGVWISLGIAFSMYAIIGNIILALSTRKLKWLLPAAGLFLVISINYSFTSFEKTQQEKIIIYHSLGNTI
ncbi:MAG TPA: ComEC family competence protein, partial [Phaeodactylibacter sp.]|nr:ComEC family competence protein [Phaeodactylibacter sp.]